MITVNSLTLSHGIRVLFDEAGIVFENGKTALVGRNGSGKTTLFNIITNNSEKDSGEIVLSADTRIGYLRQEMDIEDSPLKPVEFVLKEIDYYNKYTELLEQIKHIEKPSNTMLNNIAIYEENFRHNAGYSLPERAKKMLIFLGFSKHIDKQVKELSYGYRMRLLLTKLLLEDNNMLLLDEPTNHLDLPSIKWLEQYLLNSKKNAIIVSHDRQFLDTLCTRTIEVSNQKLNKFKGNYSFYKIEKEKIIEKEKQELSNLLEQEKQLIAFISKWKAKESKVVMAQSREKILAKVRKRISNIHIVREKDARFNYSNVEMLKSKTGINGTVIDKSYDKTNVLRDVEIDINPIKKIFLIGRNGVGKSTLVRILAGNDEKYNGDIKYNESLKLLYFDFDSISKLPGNESVLSFIQNDEPSEYRAKTLLGMMMFGEDDYDKRIRVLSGGEKIRLYLTKLFISKFNYIILDEPTNYLDIDTIDIFIKWLEGLKTGFIIVSHNEYLLKSVKSDEMWEINNGKLHIHFGNYKDYISYQKNLIVDYEEKSFSSANKPIRKKNRQQIVNKRIEINKKIKGIEEQISKLENERDEIFEMLTDANIYKRDSENVRKNRKREREITLLLEKLYNDWNKLIEKIPELD